MPKTVLDVQRITPAQLVGHARHEAREQGATDKSHIDSERTDLNRLVLGNEPDPRKAVAAHIETHGARIQKANGRPFTRLVLSASPEHFRPGDPAARGTWEPDRLEAWTKASTNWLRQEFGDDCVHAALHLDETTPHIHALVVPIPGKGEARRQTRRSRAKQRPGESDEAFASRQAANEAKRASKAAGAASAGPWVSHHGHPAFAGQRSYAALLDRYAAAVEPLGIERGERGSGATRREVREWSESELRQAREESRAATADRAAAVKVRKGAEIGLKALGDERLAFLPAAGDQADRLGWGPKAPADPTRRTALIETVRPAYSQVVAFGRRLWQASQEAAQKAVQALAWDREQLAADRRQLEADRRSLALDRSALEVEKQAAAPALAMAKAAAAQAGSLPEVAKLRAAEQVLARKPRRPQEPGREA